MMENFTNWAKAIVMAVIIVSVLEMLLPNNKTKKYVKMVMGIFILYNIISPFIKDKNLLKFDESNLQTYSSTEVNTIEVDQESMDRRIEELYIKEIEKDITKKVEKQGYSVISCRVKAKISKDENTTGITKIKLRVEKREIENNEEDDNGEKEKEKEEKQKEEIEDKLITTIQSIKKVDTKVSKTENNPSKSILEKTDIQNLKKFLIKEYEVNDKCLEIN